LTIRSPARRSSLAQVFDIRLGPSLPAFITPNVLNVLVKNYNITGDQRSEANPNLNISAVIYRQKSTLADRHKLRYHFTILL
jgi:hydroxylamine reductase (hybrid-cluster protein)